MAEQSSPLDADMLADQLMMNLQSSIEGFQKDALAQIQAEFWAAYSGEQGATIETMESVFAHQAQLVTDICEQMQATIETACAPLARMVVEQVPAWARALRAEEEHRASVSREEPTVKAVPLASDMPAKQVVTQLSWHGQWRERHEIMTPARATEYRQGPQRTAKQDHDYAQSY